MAAWVTRPTTSFGAGYGRTTTLNLPPGYRTDIAYDLVVALHHYSDNGAGIINRIDLGMSQHFKDGALLIAPDGLVDSFGNRTWYLTPEHASLAATDTDFIINGLIAAIQSVYNVRAVYGFGYSNGAMKWHEIARSNPTAINAIVVWAGALSTAETQTPANSVANPCFHLHGTSDSTVPYNGGDGSALSGSLAGHATLGAESSLSYQHGWNGGSGSIGPLVESVDLTSAAGVETDIFDYTDTHDRLGKMNGQQHTLGVNTGTAGPYTYRWALDHRR